MGRSRGWGNQQLLGESQQLEISSQASPEGRMKAHLSLILGIKDAASPYCIKKISRNDDDTSNKLDEMGMLLGERELCGARSGRERGQRSICCILNPELSTFSQAKS